MATPIRSLRLRPFSAARLNTTSAYVGELFFDSTNGTLRVFDTTSTSEILASRDWVNTAITNASLGASVDGVTIIVTDGVLSAVQPTPYVLPTASTTVKGGIKVDGTSITINGSGVISASLPQSYTLPTAGTGSGGTLGGVKVDGTTITISNGIISSSVSESYTLPTAGTGSGGTLGGVKVDGTTISITNGVISSTPNPYTLPIAGVGAGNDLGGVKVDGTSIVINQSGVISTSLPTAGTGSGGTLGGVKVDGTTITIDGNGVITSASSGYDQSLNTTDSVTFDTVTASQLISNGVGTPTYTSGNDFIFNANSGTGVLQVTGSISATKVLSLSPQSSAPVAVAGSFAVANGTGWDPASKGSGPYPVFYTGSTWEALY